MVFTHCRKQWPNECKIDEVLGTVFDLVFESSYNMSAENTLCHGEAHADSAVKTFETASTLCQQHGNLGAATIKQSNIKGNKGARPQHKLAHCNCKQSNARTNYRAVPAGAITLQNGGKIIMQNLKKNNYNHAITKAKIPWWFFHGVFLIINAKEPCYQQRRKGTLTVLSNSKV